MKRTLLPCLMIVGLSISLQAQEVQWATKVIEFSSELTPVQYSAKQVLGKPNVLPSGGQNPNAWTPDKPKRKEFLKVGFDHPINIQQLAIAESHNPSAIYRVLIYDESGQAYVVNTLTRKALTLKGRMIKE